MARKRYTEEQIIGVLKEAEVGANTSELCRKHGMSEATFYKWKAKHAGLTLNELDGGGQCLEAERVSASLGSFQLRNGSNGSSHPTVYPTLRRRLGHSQAVGSMANSALLPL